MNDADALGLPMLGPEGYDPHWDDLRFNYVDRSGNLISFRTWGRLRAYAEDYWKIKQETVKLHPTKTERWFWISTVFLGMDHSFGYGPGMFYETMVFGYGPVTYNQVVAKMDYSDLWMERGTTVEEALECHARAVEWAKSQASSVQVEEDDASVEARGYG